MPNIHSKHLTFKQGTNDVVPTHIIVVVSKKVTKLAVNRNKLKRRLRELFRLELSETPYNGGIVYTRKGAAELTFQELKSEVKETVQAINGGVN